jgi:23S rRNA (adenine2503-C2)-methyltransferase
MANRVDLAELERPALEAALAERGHQRFHARQIFQWIYRRGVDDVEAMTDLSRELRADVARAFVLSMPALEHRERSTDGTEKFLLGLADGRHIESVFIPDTPSMTFCISTQVGCAMACAFCLTGKMGLVRNLTAGEIVGQVRVLADALQMRDTPFNVVLMGMGEPLANFRNVVPAVRILMDDFGFDLSRRRVTLSTSGLVPQIYKLATETNVALAVSLHAPDDELRSELVPINRKHPIAELLEACWHYIDEQNGRSVTFEYVMLEGVNDSPAQARALGSLLKGHPAKVNLIPFNPFPGTRYKRSPLPVIQKFRDELIQRGVLATIRRTRGDDIDAACGQLAGRVIDRTTVRLGNKVFGVAQQ